MISKSFIKVLISVTAVCLSLSGCAMSAANPALISENLGTATNASPQQATRTPVVEVKPGEDLQSAINKMDRGGKLVLKSGTYEIKGTIVIENKDNMVLEGEGEVWLNTKGIDHQVITIKDSKRISLINIKAQHVIIDEDDNRRIDDGRDGSVVGVYSSEKLTFENCELVGCGIYGLYAENTGEVIINGCYIHHNSLGALYFLNRAGVTNVYLKGNRISNNADYLKKDGNINLFADDSNTIKDNSPDAYREGREKR